MKKIIVFIFGLSLFFLARNVFAGNETTVTNVTSTEKAWKNRLEQKRSEVRKEHRVGDEVYSGNVSNATKEQYTAREEKREEFRKQFNAGNISIGNMTGVRDHGAGVGAGKGQGSMHRSGRGAQMSGKKK